MLPYTLTPQRETGGNGWPNWCDGCVTHLVPTQLLIAVLSPSRKDSEHLHDFCNSWPLGQALGSSRLSLVHLSALKQPSAPSLPPGKSWNQFSPWKLFHFLAAAPVPSTACTPRVLVPQTQRPSWAFLLLGRGWVLEQVPVTVDFQTAETDFSSLSYIPGTGQGTWLSLVLVLCSRKQILV